MTIDIIITKNNNVELERKGRLYDTSKCLFVWNKL